MNIKWERPVEYYNDYYVGGGKTDAKSHDNTAMQTVPMSYAVETYGRQLEGANRLERRIVLRGILRDQVDTDPWVVSDLLERLGFNIRGVNHG